MAGSKSDDLSEFFEHLSEKTGQKLRPHQTEGIEFMRNCRTNGYGCILADEMGLGKTCQIWPRFGNNCISRGEKDEREELRERISKRKTPWNTILTTYELLINDSFFFARTKWTAVVIDEAHRLKNMESVLHEVLAEEIKYKWILLLTGTPVQNNLTELYSLLSLCHPDEFPHDAAQRFADRFSDTKNEKAMNKLRQVMKRYVLRRTKEVVSAEMPSKSEVILFHDLTDLQKELYKAILMKNYAIFDQGAVEPSKQRLMNTLVQLRKCVGHPYLFDGVEPEPFEQGEHLVKASGKLLILDVLLAFLKKRGHRVLLFSQMTRTLDIVQDYLTYRGFSYERLDGSVRGEERFAAVKRFTTTETFCFLLSTRAGGLGLNLMAADTVIFLDSDFNPQNDLQAAARAHRMGQTKHVKVIRLVGRQTVEEIILARAATKLKFTSTILAEQSEDFAKVLTAAEISEMLMFGLSEMNKRSNTDVNDADLEKLLGKSGKSGWIAPEENEGKEWIDELQMKSIYTFEGRDYRDDAKLADREALNELKRAANENEEVSILDEGKRRRAVPSASAEQKPKRVLTEEELDELREKRRELAERRKLAAEENRARREEEKKLRLAQLWKDNDYHTRNLPEPAAESDDGEQQDIVFNAANEESNVDEDGTSQASQRDPIFIIGDVTKPNRRPEHKSSDVLIAHCVDDSGSWGRGGVFTALSSLSMDIESHYELASEMNDLTLGDVHLVEVKRGDTENDSRTFVALIVAQSQRNRGDIESDAFEHGLRRLSAYAVKNRCTVHVPRIGYGSSTFNWYGAERLIRKFLCQRGVPTYIYYFPRKRARVNDIDSSPAPATTEESNSESNSINGDDGEHSTATKPKRPKLESSGNGDLPNLPDFLDGFVFHLHEAIGRENIRRLNRFIVAYGGQVTSEDDTGSATHMIVEDDVEKERQRANFVKPILTRQWLETCIKAKKLLPVD